ncbi:MAG: FliH/SctL family protein [Cyanobacteriota bacterium]
MSHSKKFRGNIVQYGQAYNILGKQEDDLSTQESQQQLSKAQIEAQKLLQNALLQVEQTINNAQEEAANILEQAKQDAVNIQAQAQETGQQLGFNQGYQAGFNQSIEETKNIIESAETIINGAYQAQKEILKNTEKEMVRLIIAISKKVIQKELKIQPDIILKLTESAIKDLKERETVKLMLNPNSIQLLKKASPILIKKINSLETIKIIEDKSIPEGGVIVESAASKIDACVETQIEEILNKLMEEATVNPVLLNLPDSKALPKENLKNIFEQKGQEQDL